MEWWWGDKALYCGMNFLGPGFAMRLAIALMVLGLGSRPLTAQVIRGQVVDSVTGVPIQTGVVFLLDSAGAEIARTVTDDDGLFLLRAPRAGRYRMRATHDAYRESTFPPFALEEEEVKAYVLLVSPVSVPEQPRMADVIDRVCPEGSHAGQPIIVGRLSDTRGKPVVDAEVVLRWSALPDALTEFADGAVSEGIAVSGATGFYAVCGAPRFTRLSIQAKKGDLLSGLLGIVFGRRTVLVGDVRTALTGLIWREDFELLSRSERTASIVGNVTDPNGRPVADAEVRISGMQFQTSTDTAGMFSFVHLPPGLVQLTVRRLGFRYLRRGIELELDSSIVLPDDALRLDFMPTQLEPVIVTAQGSRRKRAQVGFERRKEQAQGRFATREEFMEQGYVPVASEVLRKMGGLRVTMGKDFTPVVFSRRRGFACYPLVFRDNLFLGTTDPGGSIPNLDAAIPLEQIDAIEVYTSGSLPSEFSRTGAVCGAIVFWTVPPQGQR